MPLGHHRNEISVAQAIGAHTQNNDLGVELALHINRVPILTFGHRVPPSATQSSRRTLYTETDRSEGSRNPNEIISTEWSGDLRIPAGAACLLTTSCLRATAAAVRMAPLGCASPQMHYA